MNAIKAVVRNGRIETEEPLAWPEGTELRVTVDAEDADFEEGWDNSPEGIEAWLKAYDLLLKESRGRFEIQDPDRDEWYRRANEYSWKKMIERAEENFK